jgi:L,D-peptidoglycan transpeptidase YkuD (ErfK/YbiS/YcfS/YnhG family)
MKTQARSPQPARQLVVRGLSAGASQGVLTCGNLRLPCTLGRAGRRTDKREGDGATPVGRFALREVIYRPDRLMRPATRLPLAPMRADDGWCDDPQDRNYNRRVRHPYPASAERLWRDDHLYDLVVVLGHNQRPRVRGRGSAVFMHVAGPGLTPTAGCIALDRDDLLRVIARATPTSIITVSG